MLEHNQKLSEMCEMLELSSVTYCNINNFLDKNEQPSKACAIPAFFKTGRCDVDGCEGGGVKERQSVQQASQRTAIIAQSTSHFDCQTAMQDLGGEKEKSMASLIPPFSAYCRQDLLKTAEDL